MKLKQLFLLLLLSICAGICQAGIADYGYYVRLGWVGSSDMDLILRNPIDARSEQAFAPLDCFGGQKNPEWGIKDQELDDPIWSFTQENGTNYEHILAKDLFDIGTYNIIIRAFTGEADCTLDILRWDGDNNNTRTVKHLTTDQLVGTREWRSSRASRYYNMVSRVLKFTQSNNGKFLIHCNYGKLSNELGTNDPIRVYLNEDRVYTDGGHWQYNKKKTKYWIDNPWSAKVFINKKNEFKIKGIAPTMYKKTYVDCTIVIGDYLGTNSFTTNKQRKYKYKEKYFLDPK